MNTLHYSPWFDGPPWLRPRPLHEWRGQLFCIEVDEGVVVSIFSDQQLAATLFPARHWIYVLDFGQQRGDLRLEEIADRSGLEGADLQAIASRMHYFGPQDQMVVLDTGPLPTWEIPSDPPALLRAHIERPGRFYASFLRNTEELTEDQFRRVSCALAADCLRRTEASADQGAEFVARGLAEVGLGLEEIEFVLSHREPREHSSSRVETPPLATIPTPR